MKKLGNLVIAAIIIMGVGLILFVLTPLFISLFDFDTDIIGLLIFVVGVIMLFLGLVTRKR